MRAGKLNNKAEIFVPVSTRAADGSIEDTATSLGTFYCSARLSNHDEKQRDDQVVSRVRYRLMFRYSAALTEVPSNAYLILDGTTTLQVTAAYVKGHNRNREIEVLAEERR